MKIALLIACVTTWSVAANEFNIGSYFDSHTSFSLLENKTSLTRADLHTRARLLEEELSLIRIAIEDEKGDSPVSDILLMEDTSLQNEMTTLANYKDRHLDGSYSYMYDDDTAAPTITPVPTAMPSTRLHTPSNSMKTHQLEGETTISPHSTAPVERKTTDCMEYVVEMTDSYGDGWLSFYLEIESYSMQVATSDSSATDSICLSAGNYTPSCCGGQYWASEIGWEIYDMRDNLVLSGGGSSNCNDTWGSFEVIYLNPTSGPTSFPTTSSIPTNVPSSSPPSLLPTPIPTTNLTHCATGGTIASSTTIEDSIFREDLSDTVDFSVAGIGDMDGDGVPDIAVGLPSYDEDDSLYSYGSEGAVLIVFLNSTGSPKSSKLITESFIDSSDTTKFGYSVTPLGDVNSDSVVDLAVGAPHYDNYVGAVCILFMNSTGDVLSYQTIEGSDYFSKSSYLYFGYSVAALGDIDGDGTVDLAVGSIGYGTYFGAVEILFLASDGTVKSSQTITEDFDYSLGDYDYFGGSMASLGDFDGDGANDLAVGTLGDDDGGSNAGAVYILFLNSDGTVKSAQKLSNSYGDLGFTLDDYDNFGKSVANMGDLDIDGNDTPDIAVSARYDSDGGDYSGAVYIIFLTSTGSAYSHQKISNSYGGLDFTISAGYYFGTAVASAGDLDGDGISEMIVTESYYYQVNPLYLLKFSPSCPTSAPTDTPTLPPTPIPSPVPTINCKAGSFMDNTTGVCKDCARGRYWNASNMDVVFTAACLFCPVARYQNETGASECLACTAGRYAYERGTFICTACEAGKYSTETGAKDETSCEICGVGTYAGDEGSSQCTDCPNAYYLADDGLAAESHDSLDDCAACEDGEVAADDGGSCSECDAGTKAVSLNNSCTTCPRGRYSLSGAITCTECEVGYILDAFEGATSCTICAEGKFSNATSVKCSECSAGRYQSDEGSTSCIDCVAGKYVNIRGQYECTPCGSTGLTSLARSTKCDLCEKFYWYDPNDDGECTNEAGSYNGECGKCHWCEDLSDHIKCSQGTDLSNVELESGFWRAHAGAKAIFECTNLKDCVGGNSSIDGQRRRLGGTTAGDGYCGPNNHGPYCMVCNSYYSRQAPSGPCHECSDFKLTPQKIFIGLLLIIASVVVAVTKIFYLEIAGIMLIIAHRMQDQDDDLADAPHSVTSRVINKFKILCVCFQITCHIILELARSARIQYPPTLLELTETIGETVMIDPSALIPFECMMPEKNAYASRLVSMTTYPIAISLLVVLWYQTKKKFIKDDPAVTDEEVRAVERARKRTQMDHDCISLITLVLFVVLPTTSNIVFNTWYRDATDGSSDDYNENDHIYLYADYTTHVTADNGVYWNFMIPYASLCFLLYPVGIPLLFYILVRSKLSEVDPIIENAEEAKEATVTRSKGRRVIDETRMFAVVTARHANKDIAHLEYLIDAYEPEFWYWEVIQCVYRVIIANVHIVKGEYQIALSFITALVYWKIVSIFAPYTYDADDALADVTQGVVVATLFLTILIKFLGCPNWFTYIFSAILLFVMVFAIMMVLADTKEERVFLYRERTYLWNEMIYFIRNKKHRSEGLVHKARGSISRFLSVHSMRISDSESKTSFELEELNTEEDEEDDYDDTCFQLW